MSKPSDPKRPQDTPAAAAEEGEEYAYALPPLGEAWAVDRSGDPKHDYDCGQLYAETVLKHARETQNAHFVVFVLGMMLGAATVGKLPEAPFFEIGFLERLGRSAAYGSMN